MTEGEKQTILTSLERGQAALLDAVRGLDEELAARTPGSGKWSILQCLEHVAVSEDYLFLQILASQPAGTSMVNMQREARIAARGTDRAQRVESPPEALPTARFSTLQEALQGFLASRERTIQFVIDNHEDLRSRIASHPLLGTVNCYEMLLLIAAHALRHAEQMEEIKAALG